MKTVLKKDEQVVLMIRPHWLVLTWPSLIAAAGIVIGSLIGSYGLLIPLVLLCFLWYKVFKFCHDSSSFTRLIKC